jgi:outer membrane protein
MIFQQFKEHSILRSKFMVASALVLAFSMSAWGQSQKIAVIDMQGALLQTKDGQKAAADLKSKFGPKEQEFQKRQQDLAAKQEQYRKTESTMSPEAKATAEREIQTLTKNMQRDADDAKADFQQEENKLLGGIMQKMQQVMTKYATENQLAMIVDISTQPNNLLYADQSTNITAAVISLYDQNEAAAATAPASPATAQPKPPAAAPRRTVPASPGARPAGPGAK